MKTTTETHEEDYRDSDAYHMDIAIGLDALEAENEKYWAKKRGNAVKAWHERDRPLSWGY